ncbi:hypothetical protein ABIB25_002891 [Nakamurella sp. UYEF19]|uniref:DUF2020 domain-containing protein n=1 Tax=Nakamurella sp. UYEF19 TaxID=1756392 RepID=UPI0033957AC1
MSDRSSARDRSGSGLVAMGLVATGLVLTALLTGCTSASTAAPAPGTVSATPAGAASTGSPNPTIALTSSALTSSARTTPPSTAAASTSDPEFTTPSAVTSTVTKTQPGITVVASAPKATTDPAAVVGDCPYLDADVVSDITGQHHGQTQIVDLQPHPMCVFYRSDGGLMGSVRIIRAATPQQAIAAVDQHVPVAGSQPASQPAGWNGGSMTTPGQMTQDSSAGSTYAVSKGNIAVVATENESPSIKARVMAVCAIYALKLETGPTPDYCGGAQG